MANGERVVIAMSGGVDSSVAAALLVEQGCDVVGIMLRLWSEPGDAANRCCTPDAQALARGVAQRLGIPFYVLDARERFKAQVVDFLVHEYAAGRTPNPCLQCNRHLRFGYLLDYARSLGASKLATGHYARVRPPEHPGEPHRLLRGLDPAKDQSYVLHVLGQTELAAALFPLGEFTKSRVRAMALERNLPVAGQADSQDLCFVGDGDYRRFLRERAPDALRPGPVVDRAGRMLGTHAGLPLYTIGQRKGLPVHGPEPLYVLDLDTAHNALVVGTRADLGRSSLLARSMHYVSGVTPAGPLRVTARIRYKAAEVGATLSPLGDAEARFDFDVPLRDITPGQGVVAYAGDEVIGGGLIAA